MINRILEVPFARISYTYEIDGRDYFYHIKIL